MNIVIQKKNRFFYLVTIFVFLGTFLSPVVYSQETTPPLVLVGDPEPGDTITSLLDTIVVETGEEIIPTDEDVLIPVEETLVLVGDPEPGDTITSLLDTIVVETGEEIIPTDEDVLIPVEETLVLVGDPEPGDTITSLLDTIVVETGEEIIPVEIPYEEPDTEVYLTAEDIQAHLDFINSLPEISLENNVKDISQNFSECSLEEAPTLEVTQSFESVINLDISNLEHRHSFDFGFTPLGIDITIETSGFIKDLFKEKQVNVLINTESETQKGIFSIPLLTTDKESKEKSLCHITVVSE